MYGSGNRPSKLKIQNQYEDNRISITNLFKLNKENEAIKDQIIRNVRTLSEQECDYYKPIRVGNFWKNNYIDNKSNGDRKNTYQ